MKLIKTLFIISLTNLVFLISILFYFSGRTIISPVLVIPLQPTPTTTITINPTPSPAKIIMTVPTTNPLAGHCLITIDSVRYDVTSFRNQHSGGDVFTCGADLSKLFHDRHSNRFLDIMAQFRI